MRAWCMYAVVCLCTFAGDGDADRSQVERDGRALGAAAVLSSCLSFWRTIFREPALFACGLHALMASRSHTSMQAQVRSARVLMRVHVGAHVRAGGPVPCQAIVLCLCVLVACRCMCACARVRACVCACAGRQAYAVSNHSVALLRFGYV